MKTIEIAATPTHITDATLKAGPTRLLTFLQGAADPAIVAKFAPLGWSNRTVSEAWALLEELKASNLIPVAPEPNPVAEAIAACESWQNTGLIRVRALLQLRFPEQATFMFHDFVPGTGTTAVLNISSFLVRRQQLDNGTARKASRKVDHEALALLDELGVTKAFVKQLADHVEMAQKVAIVTTLQGPNDTAEKRDVTLRKIHAWITAWSDIARTVITRRDQMIRLGIAKRRAPKTKTPVPPAPPVAAGEPTPAAPAAAPVTTSEANDTAPESDAA